MNSPVFSWRRQRAGRRALIRLLQLVLFGSLGISVACQNDIAPPSVSSLAQQYRFLQLSHHAVTLALTAPYNTLQLTVTPHQASGASLAVSGSVVYSSNDTSVAVDSTGKLTAIAPATNVEIIALMTIGGVHGVTLGDTAYVNVNDVAPVPTFTTLTLTPQPGDSARFSVDGYDAMGNYPYIAVSLLDAQGNAIPDVRVRIYSRDSSVVPPNLYLLSPIRAGQEWLYFEATIYGVRRIDSLLYTVTPARHNFVTMYSTFPKGSTTPVGDFHPKDDTIAVGGSVVWWNTLGDQPMDVVFDNPVAVAPPDSVYFANIKGLTLPPNGGGNIAAFAPCDSNCFPSATGLGFRGRSFPTVGTYPYHSALYHTTGVIHVVP